MSYDQPTEQEAQEAPAAPIRANLSVKCLTAKQREAIERMPAWLRYQYERRFATNMTDLGLTEAIAEVLAFRECVAVKCHRDEALRAVELAVEAAKAFPGSTATVTEDEPGGE